MTDLQNYQVLLQPAIHTGAFGYTIYGTYAPSSAATTMQIVKMAEMLNIPSPETDTCGYMNTLKTITQAAYASRTTTLVDPRYFDWDYQVYLSEEYLDTMIQRFMEPNEPDPEKKALPSFR